MTKDEIPVLHEKFPDDCVHHRTNFKVCLSPYGTGSLLPSRTAIDPAQVARVP